jgi:uncharacterized protein (TIGR03503 family)
MFRLSMILIGWVMLMPTAMAALSAQVSTMPDTRILIDISGSMKKNDPKNLRRPALRLLVGLLPAESRAGVWTFGQYVNMLVPLGKVDESWRERAREQAGKIHSRGLFTHIEEVLTRATADWPMAPDSHQRHVVLLTDGMVDVSKDPQESKQSRERILQELLPKLRQLGVKVHTVALSARADHELMQALSNETGGWYEQVESAAELQKVFLRIFEKVGNPDTVPLKDNQFKVDGSIREITLIVFRAAGAAATRITLPDGRSFDQSNVPENFTWHQDEGYDLMTIREPQAGDWRIQAQIDPDNRVMILTDLKMLVSELPNRILVGQRVPMDVGFLDQGELVSRRKFIDMMSLGMEQIGPHDIESEPRPLRDDGQGDDPLAYDGKFEFRFAPVGEPGRGELLINAQGTTFQREKRKIFELLLPAALSVSAQAADPQWQLIRVLPGEDVIEPASMEVTAELLNADGSHQSLVLSRQSDHSYQGELNLAEVAGMATVQVRVRARSLDGNLVGTVLPGVAVQGMLPVAAPGAEAPKPVPEVAPSAPEAAVEEADDSASWLIWFGVANVLLLVLGGLAFWLVRRRSAKDAFQLVDPDEASQTVAATLPSGAGNANKEAA